MTRRCPYCHRFCTEQHICDAMARDWWSWNWADYWELEMAEFGYMAIPFPNDLDEGTWRIVLIAECRWRPAGKYDTPSRLWDGAHIVGYQGATA